MPEKTKKYRNIRFTSDVIKESDAIFYGIIGMRDRRPSGFRLKIDITNDESWSYDNEDEFFADYSRGFIYACFMKRYSDKGVLEFTTYKDHVDVTVSLSERQNIERIFNYLESNVDKCRIPEEPESELKKTGTNWVNETVNKIKTHCPSVARRLKIALDKIESKDKEEWQNAAMQIRDAWIELAQWLCEVHNVDTSDITPDSVVDRLKKLELNKSDEKLFNLAKAAFNLSMKHHKRDIDIDTAVACVTSSIVSMKTVIQEVFNAHT